jgi:kynurenine formamidase
VQSSGWLRRSSSTGVFSDDSHFDPRVLCDLGDYPPDHCIRDTIAAPRRKPERAEYTTHAIFFPAGITVIEYLTNLDRIAAARCRFLALPLALEGADGSPVRAIAITE